MPSNGLERAILLLQVIELFEQLELSHLVVILAKSAQQIAEPDDPNQVCDAL